MARPDSRQAASSAAQAPPMAGAVDLSGLKARAEAPRSGGAPSPGGGAGAGGAGSGGGGPVVEVTEQTFQADVVERSMTVPVIVDLGASWSGESQKLTPVLEKLAREGGGAWVLAKVDLDACPQIGQVFQVQSVPTGVVVAAGRPVTQFSGAQDENEMRSYISQLLDALREQMPGIAEAEARGGGSDQEAAPVEQPEDARFTAAEEALERGDHDGAVAAYEQILAAEPANAEAAAALAQVRFLARTQDADPAVRTRADENPADVDAQLAAADAEVAAGEVPAAFSRLTALVGRTAGDERERAREHLVGLFELFPTDDERVTAARRSLARVLF